MILTDGLRRLQASIGETIRAINKGSPTNANADCKSKTSIPLPALTLLLSPSEFNCEFKNDSPNEPGGQRESDASGGRPEANAELVTITKLDYERQCFRHAALIAYDALDRLQASVQGTIKAVNGSRAPVAKQTLGPKLSRNVRPSSAARPSLASSAATTQQQPRPDVPKLGSMELAPCVFYVDSRCMSRDPDPHIRSMMHIEAGGDH